MEGRPATPPVEAASPDTALPTDLRDWASPEQLLELARLNDQLRAKHRAQVDELRAELSRVVAERDGLAREVVRHERTSEAAHAMHMEADRTRGAQSAWTEERAQMVLRLQQLTNEVMRLRTGAPSVGTGSAVGTDDGHSGGRRSNGSAGLPPVSTATPSLFGSPMADALEETRAELFAALEVQHRQAFELTEHERRAELMSALHAMQVRTLEHRASRSAASAVAAQSALGSREEELAAARGARVAAEKQFAAFERQAHELSLELERTRRGLDDESERSVASLEAKLMEAESALEASTLSFQDKIGAMQAEYSRLSDQQVAALSSVTRQREAEIARLSEELDSVQEELSAVRRSATKDRAKLSDDVVRAEQEGMVINSELERVKHSYRELNEAHATAVGRVDGLAAELANARVENDRLAAEYGLLRTRLDEATELASTARDAHADRDVLLRQIEALRREMQDMKTHHDKHVREYEATVDLAQRQAEEDKHRLREQLRAATEDAAAANVRAKRAHAERDLLREKLDVAAVTMPYTPADESKQHTAVGANVNRPSDVPAAERKSADVLDLLRANAAAAANLRSSIDRSSAVGPSRR